VFQTAYETKPPVLHRCFFLFRLGADVDIRRLPPYSCSLKTVSAFGHENEPYPVWEGERKSDKIVKFV
jgi:hypothetical protein